jgi:hypothetical protein
MNINPEDARLDLDVILQHLLSHARDNPRLALALQRQTRRVMDTLDEILSPAPAAPPAVDDSTSRDPDPLATTATRDESRHPPPVEQPPPASPDNVARLIAAWQGGGTDNGTDNDGGVLLRGKALTPGLGLDRYRQLALHCRLKASAARWRARMLLGDDDEQERLVLVEQASQENLFLWPLDTGPRGPRSREPGAFQRFADTCTVCAMALDAWDRLPMEQAAGILPLIAEAQSMMRVAGSLAGIGRTEQTAEDVHWWLRRATAHAGVFIERFMKAGNPADPDEVHDLRERVTHLLDPPPVASLPAPAATTVDTVQDQDTGDQETDEEEVPTPEVARVRELLAGKTVAMFCGDRRPGKQQALVEAFALNDLLWDDVSGKYNDGDHAWIFNRPDLELVIIASGWLSHSHTYTLPKLAAERGIPVVRLPGGYGVNRVAHEILAQVSEKLAESA